MLAGRFTKSLMQTIPPGSPSYPGAHLLTFLSGTVRSTQGLGRGDPLWAPAWKLRSQDTVSRFTWDHGVQETSHPYYTKCSISLPSFFPLLVLALQGLGMGSSFWDSSSPTFRQRSSPSGVLPFSEIPPKMTSLHLSALLYGCREWGQFKSWHCWNDPFWKSSAGTWGPQSRSSLTIENGNFKHLVFSSGLFQSILRKQGRLHSESHTSLDFYCKLRASLCQVLRTRQWIQSRSLPLQSSQSETLNIHPNLRTSTVTSALKEKHGVAGDWT